jgi:ribosomal protein L7/L12
MTTSPELIALIAGSCFIVLLAQSFATVRMLAAIESRMTVVVRMEQKLDLLLKQAGVTYDPHANISPEIMEALHQRRKIKAIKLYREQTGVGLKDAKDFIEDVQQKTGLM